VRDNLRRAAAAGIAWPLGPEVTDAVLEERLFARAGVKQGARRLIEPDWPSLVREMRRPGVNLIPSPMDQNRCAHSRRPIDMIFQG